MSTKEGGGGGGGGTVWYPYVAGIVVLTVVSIVANYAKSSLDMQSNDAELIQKYLLTNDGSGSGSGDLLSRPKIWIHSKYEKNARKWESFMSRNTCHLNQPYLELVVKTIVGHCSEDFHVCLIDDASFSRLLPDWSGPDLQQVADPARSQLRQEAMLRVLHRYGGIILPNSFIAFSSATAEALRDLYGTATYNNQAFLSSSLHMIGAPKECDGVQAMVHVQHAANERNAHASEDFAGEPSLLDRWCSAAAQRGEVALIPPESIGLKTRDGRPVTIEQLFEDEKLDLSDSCFGLCLPAEDILRRSKYQWFAVMDKDTLLHDCHCIAARYLLASLVSLTETS